MRDPWAGELSSSDSDLPKILWAVRRPGQGQASHSQASEPTMCPLPHTVPPLLTAGPSFVWPLIFYEQ